jgi:hypothetical protein
MSNQEANSPVDLSTMLGTLSGESFIVGENLYTVKPMALKHVDEFMKDNLSLGAQIFNLSNKTVRDKLDKWLSGYCYSKSGEAMSLQKAMNEDWNVIDLKNFFKKLCDLSG